MSRLISAGRDEFLLGDNSVEWYIPMVFGYGLDLLEMIGDTDYAGPRDSASMPNKTQADIVESTAHTDTPSRAVECHQWH